MDMKAMGSQIRHSAKMETHVSMYASAGSSKIIFLWPQRAGSTYQARKVAGREKCLDHPEGVCAACKGEIRKPT